MYLPQPIASVIGSEIFRPENTGMSGAQVYLFDEYVLKVRPADSGETADVQALRWLSGRLPVPGIAAHAVEDGKDYLLMTRVKGRMLCDPCVMAQPRVLMDCLAEGLQLLWGTDVTQCPLCRTLREELDEAERRVAAGLVCPGDCEPETFGPGGFADPAALLSWLRRNAPEECLVLSHGDFCLPNLFESGGRLSGMIDLGACGTADSWRDLSLGWRSLKHNSDGHYGKVYPDIDPDDLFRAAGVQKDEERLRYYLLLDELF